MQFTRDKLISKLHNLKRKWKIEKKVKKPQRVALPQHGFGLINVTVYEVKHLELKVSKVRLMLEIHKKMLRRLMLEVLVSYLVWI